MSNSKNYSQIYKSESEYLAGIGAEDAKILPFALYRELFGILEARPEFKNHKDTFEGSKKNKMILLNAWSEHILNKSLKAMSENSSLAITETSALNGEITPFSKLYSYLKLDHEADEMIRQMRQLIVKEQIKNGPSAPPSSSKSKSPPMSSPKAARPSPPQLKVTGGGGASTKNPYAGLIAGLQAIKPRPRDLKRFCSF